MRIATFLSADGAVSAPFAASSVCLFERAGDGWATVKKLDYRPIPEMGVNDARRSLRDIAAQLTDCEVFLLGELRGYAHVWLDEMGFRTWKSEGTLEEQLESVAAQDALSVDGQAIAEPASCGTARGCGSGGCASGGCSANGSIGRPIDFDAAHPVPNPEPVGNAADGRFRIDLAFILETDPALNSRNVLIPILEKKKYNSLDVHFDHLPRWFYGALDALGLEADIAESAPPSHGIDARITPAKKGRAAP
jgi:Fe-only nitrogenase accessory protein AnfO